MEKQNKISRYIKIVIIYLLYIIIIPIIIYDLFLIIETNINPKSTPSFLGFKTFSIVSGSMEPTIKINDVVIVKKVNEENIKINDIITFNTDDETITHRVLNKENDNGKIVFTTKGDNNKVLDIEKIEFEQIEGKYVAKIPKVGKILIILKNKIVFAITLIILTLTFFWKRRIYSLKIKRREKREKFEEEKEKIENNN